MGRVEEGGSGPTLNPKAKHYERELFKVFAVSMEPISQTQSDWGDAKKQLEDLAKDVRTVHGELQAPADGSKGWSGPAAVAALSSLERLSETLDTHAGEIGAVDTSLGQAQTAVSSARSSWYSEVAIISTYIDPDAHKRLPAPYLPTPENKAAYSIRDPEAAAAAEDVQWEKRNQAAKKVLDQLAIDVTQAKGTMPLNFKDDKETPYENQGPASTNRTSGTASQSGADVRPTGTHVGSVLQPQPTDVIGLPEPTEITPVTPTEPPEPEICTGYPPPQDPTSLDPISSDGEVTGSTGLTPGQGTDGTSGGYPTGGSTGVSGVGAGGVAAGGIGGAAGLGGLLSKRGGGGGMFSSGGSARGSSATARGGSASARGTATGSGAGARGSAVPGGSARAGASQLAPGVGGGRSGGAAGRGGSAARGGSSVQGSTGAGKYGVPKVGKGGNAVGAGGGGQGVKGAGKAGGRGAGSGGRGVGAGGTGAAGRGGARKGDKNQLQDVDKLTHEDEEKWFEGTEESSPQVWE